MTTATLAAKLASEWRATDAIFECGAWREKHDLNLICIQSCPYEGSVHITVRDARRLARWILTHTKGGPDAR